MAIALPDLIAFAVLLLALGLIYSAKGFVDLINWFIQHTVGVVPFLGSIVSAPFDAALQAISNFLGSAAASFERYLGIVFHNMVTVLVWTGHEIAGATAIAAAIAEHLAGETVHTAGQDAAIAAQAAASIADHELAQTALNAADTAETALSAAVVALSGRIGTIEGDLSDVIEPTVEGLRTRARELEDGFQRAWDLLKQHEEALGIGAVTAATAVALEELGASWVRCDGAGAAGSLFCGLGPQAVSELLGTLLAIAAVADPCTILRGLTYLAESGTAQGALDFLASTGTQLLGCSSSENAAPITITRYAPGRTTGLGAPGAVGV